MKRIYFWICIFGLFGSCNLLADLNTGLVAYYPFNGNANDASGNGNNGTVVGAVLTTNRFGEINSAYYFGGSSSIVFSSPPTVMPQGSFTYSLWLNANYTPTYAGWWCLDRTTETTPLVSLGVGQNSAQANQFNFGSFLVEWVRTGCF
jgi:hypothetical protein